MATGDKLMTASEIKAVTDTKVDVVAGKGLSTEDYTTVEKEKLQGIAAGAQVNSIIGVKGDAESSYRTGNVNITAANIGLGNVNNTSDADKPVSTAVQAALNLKVDSVSGKGLSTNDFTDAYKAQLDALNATIQNLTSRIQTLEAKNYILYDA